MKVRNILPIFILLVFSFFLSPVRMAMGQASAGRIGILTPMTARPDATIEVPVMAQDVVDLFAVDFELRFDPTVLQAEDADPNQPGIQIGLGTFLEPGLLLQNSVDNQQGVIRFIMSQVNPSPAKSGNGVLFVLYFKGVQEGQSPLEFSFLQTANSLGEETQTEAVNSSLTINNTSQETLATSIPVANPTAMILVPTLAATATPLPNAVAQVQPSPIHPLTQVAQVEAAQSLATQPVSVQVQTTPTRQIVSAETIDSEAAMMQKNQPGGFSLAENWWIVAWMVIVFIGLVILVLRRKAKADKA